MNKPNNIFCHRIAADAAREVMGALRTAYPQGFGPRQDALAPMH